MPATKLNLLVIKSPQLEAVRDFYAVLGIHFTKEQHGRGPQHYASNIDGLVFEIYPAQSEQDCNTSTRLGFTVDDLPDLIIQLRHSGSKILSEPSQTPWGYRAVVRDPDGRSVELIPS